MKKYFIALLVLFASLSATNAQDFEIVDYSKGYYTPTPNVKVTKIHTSKKSIPLASYDFDKDGITDTIYYHLVEMDGKYTAKIEVLSIVEDDWHIFYKLPLAGMESADGIWFYELNFNETAAPEFIIYTGTRPKKYATVLIFDDITKKFKVTQYQFSAKTFFPHRFVANKKKFINYNGEDLETFEELPLK